MIGSIPSFIDGNYLTIGVYIRNYYNDDPFIPSLLTRGKMKMKSLKLCAITTALMDGCQNISTDLNLPEALKPTRLRS